MNKKLWGGRFSESTNPLVEAYTASIAFDKELASVDIQGSLAHAAMLEKCEMISSEEHEALKKGLNQILQDLKENKINFSESDEDIHMNIERLLDEKIGDVAGKLHTARSRNDQVALDLHLYLRLKIIEIAEHILNLQHTFYFISRRTSRNYPARLHTSSTRRACFPCVLIFYVLQPC